MIDFQDREFEYPEPPGAPSGPSMNFIPPLESNVACVPDRFHFSPDSQVSNLFVPEEKVWNSSMEPVSTRKRKIRSPAENALRLAVRASGGACKVHRAQKKAVSAR